MSLRSPRLTVSALLLVVFCISAFSQKEITIDDFTTGNTFHSTSVSGINWMRDGRYYTTLSANRIMKYDVTTGQPVATIVDENVLPLKLTIQQYAFSTDERKILLLTNRKPVYRRSFVGEYYVYDLETRQLKKISDGEGQSYATFSPDGSRVAFVRSNNLFYISLSDMSEIQVTNDGKFNHIINGTTDWVYEEELSFVVGFFWSPDSKKLAYYRFDETAVKEYNMQVWGKSVYPVDYRFKYPKAGEENAIVQIWIYDLATSGKVKAELNRKEDFYVPRVQWTNNPQVLAVRTMNRLQNEVDLLHIDVATGKASVILEEKSETYIDLRFNEDLVYLRDGKHFIAASERSGFKHLYLYRLDGTLINQITSGDYEVMQLCGADEKARTIYYTSTEESPLQRHLYKVRFNGTGKEKLSREKGQHQINMSSDFQFYLDHFSNSDTPTKASLFRTQGNRLIKTLEDNKTLNEKIKEYNLAAKEFFTFRTVDDTELNGYFLKPSNLVAGKKYPVVLYQYSGPGSQNAGDVFGGGHFYFHQRLVQKGYIVAVVDTRGTGGRGEKFKKLTYKQLGKYELEDLLATARYLRALPFVEPERLGIWGWSYGGYMTALAMTKGKGLFKLGIAVAPVTNWRFYDTIYTERFLQTPQLNPEGYDDNSPLTHAGDLQGQLLLIHGTGDDNVHFQNSVVLEDALINAGKQFTSFYYPDKHHGIQGGKTRHHLYTMMENYLMQNL
jgi:dipeptidyl-peptidase 4